MQTYRERIQTALNDLKNGKMIILTDNPERENEGDLIVAAEKITDESMNFLIRQGTGIVCLSLMPDQLKKLQLPLMVPPHENTSCRATPFTVSVDAKHGITTGVSAADRTKTIQLMLNDEVTPDDLVIPGHIFPLQAKPGGVLERQGHTEGAVDIMRLADLKPAAVLCEIMNPDGTMCHGEDLKTFATTHQLNVLSIDDIVHYRRCHENLIDNFTSASFPLEKYGTFNINVLKEKFSHEEHIVLHKEWHSSDKPVLVRIHSSCLTGDLLASVRCDCNKQLHYALQQISTQGGLLIYLNQEGRGIGLFDKIRTYALQEQGYDTVEANIELGLPVDSRNYYFAAAVLRHFNVDKVRLLTNNPHKMEDLKKYGVSHIERVSMPSFHHEHNHFYLQTKNKKMNHLINLNSLTG